MADTDTDPDLDEEEMSEEEKAMLAEWEAMADEGEDDTAPSSEGGDSEIAAAGDDDAGGDEAGGDEAGGDEEGEGGSNARILNQDEIDSLLGFDEEGDGGDTSGIMALINSAMVNYERLPMLDIVFDRMVRLMSTSLRNLTSDNVEVSLDQVSTVRFGDYMNSIPLPAMLSIFQAEEWDNHGLMVVDSSLIYSIVDVLLGGRKGAQTVRVEGRPYTTIEQKLVERMVHVTLSDLSSAFDPLSPVSFGLERMETNPRFAMITQSNNACVLARIRIDMGDRGGRMEIMIPYATLEPIRELLLQMFMGEKFGRDSIWENHLTQELYRTDVSLQAIVGEMSIPLDDVLNWKPGSTIVFAKHPDEPVEVRCGHFPLFEAALGQREGQVCMRLDRYIPPKKDEEEEDLRR